MARVLEAPTREHDPNRLRALPRLAPPVRAPRFAEPLTLWRIYLVFVSITTIGRLALFVWLRGRLDDITTSEGLMAFVHGLRMDTIAAGYLLVLPCLALCLAPSAWRRAVAPMLRGYVLVIALTLAFLEVATFPFFAQYDVRPNHLFVAYLEYPREVWGMLWKDQKASLVLAVLTGLVIALVYFRRRAFASLDDLLARAWPRRALWCVPMGVVLFLAIRSSFSHRAANLSDAAYSTNRVANEIAKHSAYSVAYEAYRGRDDGERQARVYGAISMDEAYRRAHAMIGTPPSAEQPFRRRVLTRTASARPRNLVIVIQESMGAQFVGYLGDDRALTPRIDALAAQGLAFTQLYSNGTRSIRGLSALSAGFQPLVGDGVVRRPKSQAGFFSIASLLEPHGYQTSFIYGGEARFDNMRSWFLGNGFDRVIEERDFESPAFRSTWGVSDEDLLAKANEVYREQHAAGRPFASVVFTSSNHTPFELPDGRIEWVEGVPRESVENAIRYADYAVGRFFEAARSEAYYENTVFVIVADHNVRVYGDDVVPIEGFHIPGVIVGESIAPMRHEDLASQPDLLATGLEELGLDLGYPILGNSIFSEAHEPFVMMQFHETYGFRRGDRVAVLRPGLGPMTCDVVEGRLRTASPDRELELDALAWLHVTEDLYERGLYR